jgi:hypothetical protein
MNKMIPFKNKEGASSSSKVAGFLMKKTQIPLFD